MSAHISTCRPLSVLVAALALLIGGCQTGSGVSEAWKTRGFTSVDDGPLTRLSGGYSLRVRTYRTAGSVLDPADAEGRVQRMSVMRLYWADPASTTAQPTEVALPDGFSVDPAVSPLFVSPDGRRVMIPGTTVDAKPHPSLLILVSSGQPGPIFEAKLEDQTMRFNPQSAVPLWSPDGRRFAAEAMGADLDTGNVWAVFFWRFADKVRTFDSRKALGPGSHHFGGWSPTGQRAVVFEGFPNEKYTVGPREVLHRPGKAGSASPPTEAVSGASRLWVLDLDGGGIDAQAVRTGSWLRQGRFALPKRTELVLFSWEGETLRPEPPGQLVPVTAGRPRPPPRPASPPTSTASDARSLPAP